MIKITTFRDLIIWQKAHQLTLQIYVVTKEFPKFELYALSSQMRRSASSIPCNITEGFKRRSNKDSCHFYNMAEASLEELKYQLILSKDLKYISQMDYNQMDALTEELSKTLYGWIQTQK